MIAARRRWLPVVAAVLVAAIALPVLASRRLAVTDPNDTRGLLDVHEVRFRPDGPSWTVITFNAWTPRKLWDRGFVLVFLDTRGSPAPDYYVLIQGSKDGLVGSLWRDRSHDVKLGRVAVRRRGTKGMEVAVPLRRLDVGSHRTVYRWSVLTLFTSGICPRTCLDPAPDATMVEEPLPSSSPSPSPTPTPTPTPS